MARQSTCFKFKHQSLDLITVSALPPSDILVFRATIPFHVTVFASGLFLSPAPEIRDFSRRTDSFRLGDFPPHL